MRYRIETLLTVLTFGMALAGCSISDSVSRSASSPFEWSSDSSRSSSEGGSEAYEGDVRDYTEVYLRSGGRFDQFMGGLGRLAMTYGITNWEDDHVTYVGIGRGLKKANVTNVELEVYKTNLARTDREKALNIQNGYDSEAR